MATARKLPSGAWRVRIYAGKKPDGAKDYQSFTADTKAGAELLANEYLTHHKQKLANITLGEAYEKYIDAKKNVLSPATYREYVRSRNADLPELMDIPLSKLTQVQVQKAISNAAKTRKAKTVRNIHALLSAVLDMFAPDFRLHTTLPKKEETQLYIPTDDDIRAILSIAEGKEIEKAILLAAFGSLRRSEICALTVDDINIDKRTVTINKAVVRTTEQNGKHTWVVKKPKTYAGYRTIELPQFVIDKLIPSKNGKIVNLMPSGVSNDFVRMRTEANLEQLRFHDLRHYQASILHAIGIPDKYIMERGGWKTDSTLKNVYQHAMKDKTNEFAEKAVSYFNDNFNKKIDGKE